MRTTIDINDATLKALRKQAEATQKSFKDVVEESLKLGLAVLSKPKASKAFKVQPHDLGLKAGFHGMSLNQMYDQIEAEGEAGR